MIKRIVKDVFFLGQKSDPATKQDLPVGQDLRDTLAANQERCVGMAVSGGCAQDDPLSEYRGGVPGRQLEKASAEILRMDSSDNSP